MCAKPPAAPQEVEANRVIALNQVYHEGCFVCSQCKEPLTAVVPPPPPTVTTSLLSSVWDVVYVGLGL